MSKTLVCAQCGYVGKPKTAVKGSGLLEVFLWLCFLAPGIMYSLWRSSSRHPVCPECMADGMIPADAPRARKIMEESGLEPEQYIEKAKQEKLSEKKKLNVVAIFTGLVLLVLVWLIVTVV